MKNNKKILIIGSDGYIGSLLTNFLKKKNFHITTLDTGYFRDGKLIPLKKSNIDIDIRRFNLKKIKDFHCVVFLAANQNDPSESINTNKFYKISEDYTIKVARACKKYKVKFIFPSSCSVYGYGKKVFNEDSKTYPLTHYSKNKIIIEKKLSKLANQNFSPIALRFSTIFGFSPRIRFDLVINMFCLLAIVNKKIILNSNGRSWRPHLSVEDACRAIYLCINKNFNNGKLNIFNVGFNCYNLKIITVARLIGKITKTKIIYNYLNKSILIADKNVKNGIDKRSYRVNFSKFLGIFPNFKRKNIDIHYQIKKLINSLKKLKINRTIQKNINFYRLQKMDYLIKNKKVNKNLYWINK